MKNISIIYLLLFFSLFSCTPESRELTYKGARNVTEKEFKAMLDNGEVDHVEADEKDVYVYLTDEAARRRDALEAPQFHFTISSYESFLDEMESLDREYIVRRME